MATDRDPIEALAATRAKFGPGPRRLKLGLLERLASAPPSRRRDLRAFRDAVLFIKAYPDDVAVHRAALSALRAVSAWIAGDHRLAGRLDDSGIPGTTVEAPFSLDLARWLVRRSPGDVEIAWEDGSAGAAFDQLLGICTPVAQRDGLLAEGLTTEAWLRLAAGTETGTGGGELAWLLHAIDAIAAPPELVDHAFESSALRLRWRVAELPPDGGLPRRRRFMQRGPIERVDDPAALVQRPLPDTRPLPARQARTLIDTARITLAALRRETDPVTYANPREVTRFELARGVDIVTYGLLPERRLPLESFFGYLAARNGVPVAYGGGWIFFNRCEIGINIFEQFRGGESAYLFGQVLRVYRHHFNARRFLVDPFQFGADNRDGIRSGAFWFYYRFGFRPVDTGLAALADREWSRIRADRAYRTPTRTLRRLAAAKLAMDVGAPADASEVPDVVQLGLAVTRAGGKPAADRGALGSLAALIDDLAAWPATDRRSLDAVIHAKLGPRERDYVLKMQRHGRLRDALAQVAIRSDGATER